MAEAGEEFGWERVWGSIGEEVWRLAPQDYQDSGHRDLKFGTNWQDIMYAVHQGIEKFLDEREAGSRGGDSDAGATQDHLQSGHGMDGAVSDSG